MFRLGWAAKAPTVCLARQGAMNTLSVSNVRAPEWGKCADGNCLYKAITEGIFGWAVGTGLEVVRDREKWRV